MPLNLILDIKVINLLGVNSVNGKNTSKIKVN